MRSAKKRVLKLHLKIIVRASILFILPLMLMLAAEVNLLIINLLIITWLMIGYRSGVLMGLGLSHNIIRAKHDKSHFNYLALAYCGLTILMNYLMIS